MTTDNGPSNYPVPVNDKPLNQGQAKNLQKIVELDFEDLRAKVFGDIERMLHDKLQKLDELSNQDEADRMTTAVLAALTSTLNSANETFQEFLDQAIDANPGLDFSGIQRYPVLKNGSIASVKPGMERAKIRVQKAASNLRKTASSVISKRQREIERLILVQTISHASATELLNDMPDPEDIVAQVREALNDQNTDDIDVLMSDDFNPRSYVEAVSSA